MSRNRNITVFPRLYALLRPTLVKYADLYHEDITSFEDSELIEIIRNELTQRSKKWSRTLQRRSPVKLNTSSDMSTKAALQNILMIEETILRDPKLEEEVNLLYFYMKYLNGQGRYIPAPKSTKDTKILTLQDVIISIAGGIEKATQVHFIGFINKVPFKFPSQAYKVRHRLFYATPEIEPLGFYLIPLKLTRATVFKVLIVGLDQNTNQYDISGIEDDFRIASFDFDLEIPSKNPSEAIISITDLWDSNAYKQTYSIAEIDSILQREVLGTSKSEQMQFQMIKDTIHSIVGLINTNKLK